MPEGPEVRRYADELSKHLLNRKIADISARTKNAKAWLSAHPQTLLGRTIESVFAHGKNIVIIIEGGYYLYSHQMMWGRWQFFQGDDEVARDRRERARIKVPGATAVLMSAPVFEIGSGDPFLATPYLAALGPNVLDNPFDSKEFLRRLKTSANESRTIGDALLDQTILAGLGNYLRAEIMFLAKIDPWTRVSTLSSAQLKLLATLIPSVTNQAYELDGITVTPALHERMGKDPRLVYVPGKEYGTRHYVFRRTNLPCLLCDEPVKQLRQELAKPDLDEDSETEGEIKTRIVYFCAHCQNVNLQVVKAERPTKAAARITMKKTAITAQAIQKTILELLKERGDRKTICPSEVARLLAEDWEDLMPKVRKAADSLKQRELVKILQKGKSIASAVEASGPIRLKLA